MAGRTSVGTGVGITIGLTSVAALAFFVFALIFFGQKQSAEKALADLKSKTADIARDAEINNESVRLMIEEARKEKLSLAGYLTTGLGNLAEKLTGSKGDSLATLTGKVNRVLGDKPNLLQALADTQAERDGFSKQAQDAKDVATRASNDLASTVKRVGTIEEGQKATTEALASQVGEYKTKIEDAQKALDARVKDMQSQVNAIKQESSDQKAALNDRITKLSDEKLVLENKIKQLSADRAQTALKAGEESNLVDGVIVSQDFDTGHVVIDRGRKDKLVLGMTFEVYGDAAQIRIDSAGRYSRGKGVIEVIRMEDRTATCRVLSAARGATIAKNDVILNPVYDPSKVYTFVVFGNFDPSNSGIPSAEGTTQVRSIIEEWGGKVTDTLGGEVDFLVLGARPVLPPKPATDAAGAVFQEYARLLRQSRQYDELFSAAAAASIPVLNENRLNTLLTGR